MNNNIFWYGVATVLAWYAQPAHAFSTMATAQAQSCSGTVNMADGAVGQDSAGADAQSSGACGDGSSSSAVASASSIIALGQIVVDGDGTGLQEFNGVYAQASFGERLTVEDVPVRIDAVDLRVVIAFTGIPPATAFESSASMLGTVNPQSLPGEIRLAGCSGDLCSGGDPEVRTETLEQVITLNRNGAGAFGNIDIFVDARFEIASTTTSITGTVSVELLGVPEGRLMSESGMFGTGAPDTDSDGVDDASDNCISVANADQRDTDADAIGNVCDPDVAAPNDCMVNFADLNLYKINFFQSGDLDTDNNNDGQTNFADLTILKNFFFGPPGPSAAGCN